MKKKTPRGSLSILKRIFGDKAELLGINWNNHRQSEFKENTFQITINMLSLEALIDLMDHKSVKNVYWHPSMSPPGASKDPIALRYRLFVEYH